MNRKGREMVREFQEEEISKGGQESPMSCQEVKTGVKAMQEERQASDNEWLRSMEKHPRCAMLPSPEKLNSSMDSPGSDETDTLREMVREFQEEEISKGGQESPMSCQEVKTGVKAMQEERQASYDAGLRSMEKHARCAMLPSPELLNLGKDYRGSDKTGTLGDFGLIKDWVTKAKLLNARFYDTIENEQLEDGIFSTLIQLAFSNAFDAMRNTARPELSELVFWYYAGHGLGKEAAKTLLYCSTPCLDKVRLEPDYFGAANEFVKEGRKVQGGELCLHHVGFCGLHGLLKPWIAALKSESINKTGIKKNKHLVIILDSCHSGMIAKELKEFQKETLKNDPSLLGENNNSITIQAACGPDERTFGGYFTPCFVYLNDPKNEELLNGLVKQWKGMTDEERDEYKSINLPSPMVVTTCSTGTQSQDPTIKVEVQNFKLTLFQDPGFFKFCSIKVYQHQDEHLFKDNDRVLSSTSAKTFMSSPRFTVLDYKLKTYKGTGPTDPNAGTPMGLFLLDDPKNSGVAVCAHIHFKKGNTAKLTRINLVHHKKLPMESTLYIEDHLHKIVLPLDANATKLVTACRQCVDKKEPGRWTDVTKWSMTGMQFGVNGLFRVQQERSAWEDIYLKHIKQFNLPEAAQ